MDYDVVREKCSSELYVAVQHLKTEDLTKYNISSCSQHFRNVRLKLK